MSGDRPELLVVVKAGDPTTVIEQLRGAARVIQVLPPRLVLIEDTPGARDRAVAVDGVLGVYNDLTVLEHELDATQRAFVRAWDTRRQAKRRPGEGLDWDTAGFEPPNGPR